MILSLYPKKRIKNSNKFNDTLEVKTEKYSIGNYASNAKF